MTGQEVPILVFCHDITSISLVSLHNKTSHHSRVTGHVTGHVSPRDIHQTDR